MNSRRILLLGLVMVILTLGVSAVSAQEPAVPPGGPVGGALKEVTAAVAEAIGLTPEEIVAQLAEGQSVADIITAQGGDVTAVKTEVVAILTERIHAAVADGKLPQRRADRLLGRLDMVVERVLNSDRPGQMLGRIAQVGVVRLAANETGLTPREIITELRDGKSLADVLTANGVDVTAFIDDAAQVLDKRLDKLVERGQLTPERADELLQQFRDKLAERINQPKPLAPDAAA